jgi:hypothetical protein
MRTEPPFEETSTANLFMLENSMPASKQEPTVANDAHHNMSTEENKVNRDKLYKP